MTLRVPSIRTPSEFVLFSEVECSTHPSGKPAAVVPVSEPIQANANQALGAPVLMNAVWPPPFADLTPGWQSSSHGWRAEDKASVKVLE